MILPTLRPHWLLEFIIIIAELVEIVIIRLKFISLFLSRTTRLLRWWLHLLLLGIFHLLNLLLFRVFFKLLNKLLISIFFELYHFMLALILIALTFS
jgi:hypothetical protein